MSETSGEVIASACDDSTWTRRHLRRWHVVGICLLVPLIGVLAVRWHWKREFRQRIEAIAAAGYPVTCEELDARYKWPESGDNAADWIIGAGTYCVEPPEKEYRRLREIIGGAHRPIERGPLSDEVGDLLARHVQANTKALELLHHAVAIEESRYPIDLSKGAAVLVPHIQDVRNSGLLLCFEAVLYAEKGDSEGAVRAVEAAFQVADTLRMEPVYISQLVRLWIQRWAVGAVERTLSQIELSDAELLRLAQVVSQGWDSEATRRLLAGDRCMCLDLFQKPEAVDPGYFQTSPGPAPTLLELYNAAGLAARDGTVFLDMMEACLATAELPLHQRYDASEEIETHFLERSEKGMLLKHVTSIWHGLRSEVQCLAILHDGLAGLAVERYRLKKGDWPQTLAELIPEYLPDVLEDPFDGAPLRYKRLNGGFVVYSVGEDRVDDDGRERRPHEEGKPDETYDITFMVQR